MAKGLKYTVGSKVLKRAIEGKGRKRNLVPFSEAKSFLILYDELQEKNDLPLLESFIEHLINAGKLVYTVVYHHTRKKKELPTVQEEENKLHLSKLDFNYLGLPKTTAVKKLIARHFDFLINLNLDGRVPLKSIAAFTNAGYRIGYNREKNIPYFDLLLGNKENSELEQFTKDIIYYIKKIG